MTMNEKAWGAKCGKEATEGQHKRGKKMMRGIHIKKPRTHKVWNKKKGELENEKGREEIIMRMD